MYFIQYHSSVHLVDLVNISVHPVDKFGCFLTRDHFVDLVHMPVHFVSSVHFVDFINFLY